MFLSVCFTHLGTNQKILVRPLKSCFHDLSWQQTSFQLEEVSFSQFKQVPFLF